MKGYKAFEKDLTCRNFQYEVGKTYEMDGTPICCNKGFHFCKTIADVYNYYPMSDDTRICEVEAIGVIDTDDDIKYCTNKIVIVKEIEDAVVKHCNQNKTTNGFCNTGFCNTGDCNTGNRNTGNWNTGCFNTKTDTVRFFDRDSEWTYDKWLYSNAQTIMSYCPSKCMVEWINEKQMTNEEKCQNPTYETTGGYLKVSDMSETRQSWWNFLSDKDKECVMLLPNFDAEIFYKCTGIKVEVNK